MEICRHIAWWTRRLRGDAGLTRHQAGVDGDRQPDLTPEALGEGVLELAAQPTLELGAREVVSDRDDHRVPVPADRFTAADPGLLVRLELLDDVLPGAGKVGVVVHRLSRSFVVRVCAACAEPERPATCSDRSSVPQVCPHLVNVAAALWKQPAKTLTSDRQ